MVEQGVELPVLDIAGVRRILPLGWQVQGNAQNPGEFRLFITLPSVKPLPAIALVAPCHAGVPDFEKVVDALIRRVKRIVGDGLASQGEALDNLLATFQHLVDSYDGELPPLVKRIERHLEAYHAEQDEETSAGDEGGGGGQVDAGHPAEGGSGVCGGRQEEGEAPQILRP
jgi:hypothetical protein